MSNEAPTDALRLVPVKATPQQLETAAFNLSAEIGAAEAMKLGPHIERAYELLVAAAPASPLPGGGPTCQLCSSKIEGWICQGCGSHFCENDAGALVLNNISAAPKGDA